MNPTHRPIPFALTLTLGLCLLATTPRAVFAGPSTLALPEAPAFAEPAEHRNMWLLAAAAASLGTGCVIALALVVERRRRTPESERAFRALAPKLGLSRKERRAVRTIAAGLGAKPVALLLCPNAVGRATERDGLELDAAMIDTAMIDALQRKLGG
ncbi:MAG: hypothetical protein AAF138_10380 [Planctomycetota bacterium]